MSLLSAFITRRFSSPGGVPSAEASCDDGTRSARQLACDSPPHTQPKPPTTTAATAIAVPTTEERPTTLIDRFRRYSSFSRPAHDAVLEEDCNGLSIPSLAAPTAIPHDTAYSTMNCVSSTSTRRSRAHPQRRRGWATGRPCSAGMRPPSPSRCPPTTAWPICEHAYTRSGSCKYQTRSARAWCTIS
jgi:hypothetical protein